MRRIGHIVLTTVLLIGAASAPVPAAAQGRAAKAAPHVRVFEGPG